MHLGFAQETDDIWSENTMWIYFFTQIVAYFKKILCSAMPGNDYFIRLCN